MKEKKIKELLGKSKIETSTDFTDKLMAAIELNKKAKNTVIWPFKRVFLIVTSMIIFFSYVVFRFLSLIEEPQMHINNLRTPLFLVTSIVFLLSINYLIRLNEGYKNLKKES